jgi:hypothetical protein
LLLNIDCAPWGLVISQLSLFWKVKKKMAVSEVDDDDKHFQKFFFS